MHHINKIIQGISIVLGIWGVCSYAAIQKETTQPASTFDHFFTNVEAGVNGGYIAGLSTVYGGLNGKVTVFQQGAYFSEVPMHLIFGNSGFFGLSGGITGGYNLNSKTLLRGYGIFDEKHIQGGLDYPEGIIGIEGYEVVPWGIQNTGAIHASSTFSLSLASTTSKLKKEDYSIDIAKKSIMGNVTYDKAYMYQNVRVGYLPGYYGIEVYTEPYIIYPSNDNFQLVQSIHSDMVVGYGGGIENVIYFSGVKITNQIGIRNDSLTGFSVSARIEINKKWINQNKQEYKQNFSTANHYRDRPLPYFIGGMSALDSKGSQPLDKNLLNYNMATNNDEFHHSLDELKNGHIKVLILTEGDYSLDKDLSLKDKAIVCSTYYCEFTLKNGDQVTIQNGNATIKTGVGVEQNTRPRVTFNDNNIIQLSTQAQVQGLYLQHKTEAKVMQVESGDQGGNFLFNEIPTRLTISNTSGNESTFIMNNNIMGALTIKNAQKDSTFLMAMNDNLINGKNLPTKDSLLTSEFMVIIFKLHTYYTLDGHMASGIVNIVTSDDKGFSSVVDSAKIRIAGKGNKIDITSGTQNKSILFVEGDVAMHSKQDKIFDTITINGDVKNTPCAICFVGFTTESTGINIGDININGSVILGGENGVAATPGTVVLVGGYELKTEDNKSLGKHNLIMKAPLKIGNISVKNVSWILYSKDNAYDTLPVSGRLESSITIGNIKADTVESVYLYNYYSGSSTVPPTFELHFGNVTLNILKQHLGSFVARQGKIEFGNITINDVQNFLIAIIDPDFTFKGHWKFGNITIKRASTIPGNNICSPSAEGFICLYQLVFDSSASLTIGDVNLPGSPADYASIKYIIGYLRGGGDKKMGKMDGKIHIGSVTSNAGLNLAVLAVTQNNAEGNGTFSIGSGKGKAITGAPVIRTMSGAGLSQPSTLKVVIVSDATPFITFGQQSFSNIGDLTTWAHNENANFTNRFTWSLSKTVP